MRGLASLCLVLSLAACSGSGNVPADPGQAPSGLYDTDYGTLALTAPTASGTVEGAYADATSLSSLRGVYRDGTLTGRWATQFLTGTCEPDEDGLTLYGAFTFEFNDDLSGFNGVWGYCEDGAQTESWDGSYEGPRPNAPSLNALVAPAGGVRPSPNAGPPAGIYLTGRGEIMILPPNANGEFIGSLDEDGQPLISLAGTIEGSTLTGVWTDVETQGRCPRTNGGSTHYGRFELELRDAGSTATLRGNRGTCLDGPLTQSLSGLRQ